MSYWRYKAYDDHLAICEGVLIGPHGPGETVVPEIILHLRQCNLQVISLDPISQAEYHREKYLDKLKNRLTPSSTRNVPPPGKQTEKKIQGLWAKLKSLLTRRPNT